MDDALNIGATSGAAKILDMDDYRAVPPNRVFHVATRYVYAGRGKPLGFDIVKALREIRGDS